MALRLVGDILDERSGVSPLLSQAVASGIVSESDQVSNGLLLAIHIVAQMKNENQESNVAGMPTYAAISAAVANHPESESGSLSKSTIKRALDIVYLRTEKDGKSANAQVCLLDHIVSEHFMPSLVQFAEKPDPTKNDLALLTDKIQSLLIPLAVAKGAEFELKEARLVLAEAVAFKLKEPESSYSGLRRFIAKKFGTAMSLASYNKVDQFVVMSSAENIFDESDVGFITNALTVSATSYYKENVAIIGEARAREIMEVFTKGVIEALALRGAYID